MNRILLSGCAGFIGSKVSEVLLQQGYAVIGVDDLNDAYDVRLKEWRLKRLQSQRRFQFHRVDIADRRALEKVFAEAGPLRAVVNLAARAGVRQSVEDPWVYYRTNVVGAINLLELCKATEIGKFAAASSSSVYGISPESGRPLREDLPTDRPLSPYAASKKAMEALCHSYHHLYDLDIVLFRYFTVYGPAGRPDMSIFRFVKWIAEGEPLILYGDGTQERDFTYIDDIARGTVLALEQTGYQIFNLGNNRPVAITRLISLIEELLGKKAQIDRQPAHRADVRATWASIDRARELLGWEPETRIEQGVEFTVDWYLENREWAKKIQT